MTINPKEELHKFQASVNDDKFAFDLINGLARSFLAAEEPRTQVRLNVYIATVN